MIVTHMIYEYPLEGHPPMMTHVYESTGNQVVVAKGAAERIPNACRLSIAEREKVNAEVKLLASSGYRVLGGGRHATGPSFPSCPGSFCLDFYWPAGLYDPPKKCG